MAKRSICAIKVKDTDVIVGMLLRDSPSSAEPKLEEVVPNGLKLWTPLNPPDPVSTPTQRTVTIAPELLEVVTAKLETSMLEQLAARPVSATLASDGSINLPLPGAPTPTVAFGSVGQTTEHFDLDLGGNAPSGGSTFYVIVEESDPAPGQAPQRAVVNDVVLENHQTKVGVHMSPLPKGLTVSIAVIAKGFPVHLEHLMLT